jgi:hypothetical protein
VESPEQKKHFVFLVLKKRPKEALFRTLEILLFCEDLKREAGIAPEN